MWLGRLSGLWFGGVFDGNDGKGGRMMGGVGDDRKDAERQ
jgi:hypothetical protein